MQTHAWAVSPWATKRWTECLPLSGAPEEPRSRACLLSQRGFQKGDGFLPAIRPRRGGPFSGPATPGETWIVRRHRRTKRRVASVLVRKQGRVEPTMCAQPFLDLPRHRATGPDAILLRAHKQHGTGNPFDRDDSFGMLRQ